MSHEKTLLDTIVTAEGTERAWHGLDVQATLDGLSHDEFAARLALDYPINCEAFHWSDGVQIADQFGLRDGSNGMLLHRLNEMVEIVQPKNFATLANLTAQKMGGKVVSGGTIYGKKRGFISIDLGEKINLPGGDTINQFVTFTISWDGTFRFSASMVDYRTVCNNTYPSPECKTLWEAKQHHGFQMLPLSVDFDAERISDFITDQYLGKIRANREKYEEVIGKLTTTHFDGARDKNLLRFASIMADGKATLDRIVQMEVPNDASFLDRCIAATVDQDAWQAVRTSGLSNIGTRIVAESLEGLGSEMESASGTLWGMLNGYTYYTDHLSGATGDRGRKQTEEDRQGNVLFGGFTKQKENAILLLSAIANSQSA